ncbi:MAG: hypothetical protein WCS77_05645 [Elusimicrobiaceae bacterium]
MRKNESAVLVGVFIALFVLGGTGHAFWFFPESDGKKKQDAKERITAPEVEFKSCADKFDNGVAAPIEPPNYEALANNLADQLGLNQDQERRLRVVLENNRGNYEELIRRYEQDRQRLERNRAQLVELRDAIQKTINSIPSVVMQKLEDDQKKDYLAIIQKQMAEEKAKNPVFQTQAATPAAEQPAVSSATVAAPVIAPKKKRVKKAPAAEQPSALQMETGASAAQTPADVQIKTPVAIGVGKPAVIQVKPVVPAAPAAPAKTKIQIIIPSKSAVKTAAPSAAVEPQKTEVSKPQFQMPAQAQQKTGN